MEVSCDVTTTNELKCIIYDQVISLKMWEPQRGECVSLSVTTGQSSAGPKGNASSGSTVGHRGRDRTPHHTGSPQFHLNLAVLPAQSTRPPIPTSFNRVFYPS